MAGIIMPAIAPFLSLFVHESAAKLRSIEGSNFVELTQEVANIVKESRHSLKYFDDSKKSVAELLAYMDEVVVPAHREKFLGNAWLPWARRFESDLGIYSYNGLPIANTHGISMSMGLTVIEIVGGVRERVVEVATAQGEYFSRIGATFDNAARSFATEMDPALLKSHDRRSEKVYGRAFASFEPNATAFLINHACVVNLMREVLRLDRDSSSVNTVMKLRYLTLYQVARSLEIVLNDSRFSDIDSKWRPLALKTISSWPFREVISEDARPLRNTLMHYGLDSRISAENLDLSRRLYGLPGACLGGMGFDEFAGLVDESLLQLQMLLNNQLGRI
ncbi:hypothetical protein WIS52_14865 [Pseudonocardia nematodicida]|uniref:Uncharacterized protein n=1 Tax=Pseudonocardia nematodicida TaxID=1206997 RepID=A0ABV1KBB9_9PSEU